MRPSLEARILWASAPFGVRAGYSATPFTVRFGLIKSSAWRWIKFSVKVGGLSLNEPLGIDRKTTMASFIS